MSALVETWEKQLLAQAHAPWKTFLRREAELLMDKGSATACLPPLRSDHARAQPGLFHRLLPVAARTATNHARALRLLPGER